MTLKRHGYRKSGGPVKARHAKKRQRSVVDRPLQIAALPDLLLTKTGKTTAYWLTRVETLIRANTSTPKHLAAGYSMHGETNVGAWLTALTAEILQHFPVGRLVDGNMWAASVLGLILTLWYARLAWGKANDPARPIADRVGAYDQFVEFAAVLSFALHDPHHDATVWPNQRWQSPFTPDATSGGFR